MPKYPMTAVVAERRYDFAGSSGSTQVKVSLGTPAPFPDTPPRDWYCPYRVEGPDRAHEFYAGGVDSLQAMLMALSAIRAQLHGLGHTGKLTFHGDSDVSIALVGGAA